MFRKKEKMKNTSQDLRKESENFHKVIKKINAEIKPEALTKTILESIAKEYNVSADNVVKAFESSLKKNAQRDLNSIKNKSDYSYLQLEQAVEQYGFELDDLK